MTVVRRCDCVLYYYEGHRIAASVLIDLFDDDFMKLPYNMHRFKHFVMYEYDIKVHPVCRVYRPSSSPPFYIAEYIMIFNRKCTEIPVGRHT